MARRIVAALKRAIGEQYVEPSVHFHQGASGHPAVCHVEGCTSPRLEVV
jgi:hypothetical protein